MYRPLVRILLLIPALFMLWRFYMERDLLNLVILSGAVVLIISGYFTNGTVYTAFKQVRKGNFEKASKLISKTKLPNMLQKSQKAYYYFTLAFIEFDKKNYNESSEAFIMALNIGLRTQNDTSIGYLHLADIEQERGNLIKAQEYLDKSKSYEYKEELYSEIQKVQIAINEQKFDF